MPEQESTESRTNGLLNHTGLHLLVLTLAVLAAFRPALSCGFVNWDDPELVLDCPQVRSLGAGNLKRVLAEPTAGAYLPARTISYAVDHAIAGGYGARWFHASSIIWHLLGCMAAYFLAARLLGDRRVALLAALLFALHPTRVEGAAWVSGRKELLVTLSSLLAVLAYAKAVGIHSGASCEEDSRRGNGLRPSWYLAAVGLTLVALCSKATAVVIPAWVLALEICFGRDRETEPWRGRILRQAPFWVLSLIFTYVHLRAGKSSAAVQQPHGLSYLNQLCIAARTPAWNLRLLLWPLHLGAYYHPELKHPLSLGVTLAAFAFDAALLAAGVALLIGRRSKALAFGYWWFFIGIVPTANLVPTSIPIADRYVHLPGFGFALLTAIGLAFLVRRAGRSPNRVQTGATYAATALLLLAYCGLARLQCRTWRNSLSLWRQAVAAEPVNPVAWSNLALAEEALMHRRGYAVKLAEEAVRQGPQLEFTHTVLAELLARSGDAPGAIVEFNKALLISPGSRRAVVGLVRLYAGLGAPRLATRLCDEYLRRFPADSQVRAFRAALQNPGQSPPGP